MPEMFAAPVEEGAFDVWAPENVSPLVAFLASPAASRVTGQVFIIWGNEVKLLQGPRVERSFVTDGRWTAEGLAEQMGEAYEEREPGQGFVVPPS